MNAAQVKALRVEINAAHAACNLSQAQALQEKLHEHFVKESDAFISSPEGRANMDRLVDSV